ncbi:MAG: sulfotransferase [Gemmatimonadota bacterium]
MTRVIFVASWSRSGSTLLDLLLGHVAGVRSLGEVRYLWDRGMLENQLCGCLRPFSNCPFWGGVLDRLAREGAVPDAGAMLAVRERLSRPAALPRLLRASRGQRARGELAAYADALGRVLHAAADVSGARLVVDSSKYATHGLALASAHDVELHVVHVVRDSRAVAHSWQRVKRLPEVHWKVEHMPRKSPARSAFHWARENAAIGLLASRARSYVRLRYEDVVRRPAEALRRVISATGEPSPDVAFLRDGGLELAENHLVAGNPVRFTRGWTPVSADTEWRQAMPAGQRTLVTALTWPLLLAYGFALRREVA